jgi:hypothetical protein
MRPSSQPPSGASISSRASPPPSRRICTTAESTEQAPTRSRGRSRSPRGPPAVLRRSGARAQEQTGHLRAAQQSAGAARDARTPDAVSLPRGTRGLSSVRPGGRGGAPWRRPTRAAARLRRHRGLRRRGHCGPLGGARHEVLGRTEAGRGSGRCPLAAQAGDKATNATQARGRAGGRRARATRGRLGPACSEAPR